MLRKEDFEPNMKTEDKIPGAQTENPAQSQRFGDFIVKYMQDVQDTMELFPGTSFQAINEIFGVLYVPLESMGEIEVTGISYNSIPKCYTYMDMEAAGKSGINRLHDHPYLKLRGKGTAVAVIDSGIDYQNEVFRNAGGSRIAYLWDQSIEDEEQNQSGRESEAENGDADNLPEEGDDITDTEVPYGKLFRKKDIDRALDSEDPFAIVPSRDTNGHGTALAGIAAGNMVPGENFTGAAPEATLIIIKVKPAKQYLRNFYLYPPEAEVFQENDVMMAIAFAITQAKKLKMPLSICLGIGSSQGAHLGTNALSQYVDYVANFSQVSVSVAAGNEGNTRNHSAGFFSQGREQIVTELCFCGNKGVCELYPDRASDRIFAGVYSIFPSGVRYLENFYQGKKSAERKVPYVASCGRADLPGYLFSGTIPLYYGDSAGRRQEQHHGNRLPAP